MVVVAVGGDGLTSSVPSGPAGPATNLAGVGLDHCVRSRHARAWREIPGRQDPKPGPPGPPEKPEKPEKLDKPEVCGPLTTLSFHF